MLLLGLAVIYTRNDDFGTFLMPNSVVPVLNMLWGERSSATRNLVSRRGVRYIFAQCCWIACKNDRLRFEDHSCVLLWKRANLVSWNSHYLIIMIWVWLPLYARSIFESVPVDLRKAPNDFTATYLDIQLLYINNIMIYIIISIYFSNRLKLIIPAGAQLNTQNLNIYFLIL